MDGRYVSVRDVASELGVTPQSVRNWIHAGDLDAMQTPGGTYRILRSSVAALRQRRMPSDETATVPNLRVGHDDPDRRLTTGQAAQILGTTSRHVIDLCDRGELPYTLAGAHRRLRLSDVAAFRDRRALSGGGPLTEDQQRALWLGYALAARVAADPIDVLERARQRAVKMLASDPAGARWLRDWLRLIDQGPDAVMRALVSRSPQSRELRQNLPFAGELSEAERARLISAFRSANPRG